MDRDCLPVLLIKFPTKWTERDGITVINETKLQQSFKNGVEWGRVPFHE